MLIKFNDNEVESLGNLFNFANNNPESGLEEAKKIVELNSKIQSEREIETEEGEQQDLIDILDMALKQEGIRVAQDVVYFMNKIRNELQQQQIRYQNSNRENKEIQEEKEDSEE